MIEFYENTAIVIDCRNLTRAEILAMILLDAGENEKRVFSSREVSCLMFGAACCEWCFSVDPDTNACVYTIKNKDEDFYCCHKIVVKFLPCGCDGVRVEYTFYDDEDKVISTKCTYWNLDQYLSLE